MLNLDEARNRYIGRVVANIEANEFICEDQKELIGITLLFEDSDFLSIRLNGDGTGFILDNDRPETLDMEEFGRTTLVSWAQFGGEVRLPTGLCNIGEVLPVHDTSTVCFELTITLDNSQKIALKNSGDQLRIHETI